MKKTILCSILFFGVLPLTAGRLQTELNHRLKGGWVVLSTEVSSSCDSGFTNNTVNQNRVLGKASYSLSAGELGQIYSIDLKRSRVDVHIKLETPLRISWVEGPFQLYEHRSCGIELQVELPRKWVKSRKIEEIIGAIYQVVEPFPTREAAMSSSSYNGRETEPFPEGYQQTLAEYEVWKIEQMNIKIHQERQQSLELVNSILARVSDSPDYSRGFVAGIKDIQRELSWDCDDLIDAAFHPDRPPSAARASSEYTNGYKDGQEVAYHTARAERLFRCLR
ncbi:MAG: hypothetical protein CSA81_12805 [Acidobacteria bacterium]|nr:MAG: hypothetical protein CSA81_12805 [Acidobacteriota bacterium]